MNRLFQLLTGLLLAGALTAAEAPKPPVLQMRLVLEGPAPEAETMTCWQNKTEAPQRPPETLHVQKTALLDHTAVKSAVVVRDLPASRPVILVTLTPAGQQRFAEVTRTHIGQRLAIVMDGRLYSAPRIMTEIAGGKAQISGSFTEAEAGELARKINEAAVQPKP